MCNFVKKKRKKNNHSVFICQDDHKTIGTDTENLAAQIEDYILSTCVIVVVLFLVVW